MNEKVEKLDFNKRLRECHSAVKLARMRFVMFLCQNDYRQVFSHWYFIETLLSLCSQNCQKVKKSLKVENVLVVSHGELLRIESLHPRQRQLEQSQGE